MDFEDMILIASAIIPAIFLCAYIYKKDRVEKEPLGLLLLLFIAGSIICFPAAHIEGLLDDVILKGVSLFAKEEDGIAYISKFVYRLYQFADNFLNVAVVEEGLKFIALILITKRNKNFNSMFDGMIYAIFVSLGFAALENIMYTMENGIEVAIARSFTAVPGHMFFATIMGYYYSFWHLLVKVNKIESDFKAEGVIPENAPKRKYKRYIVLSLLMPIMAHGFYDICLSIDTTASVLIFYAFLIFMYFYCFGKIRKISRIDGYTNNMAMIVVAKRYPKVIDYLNQN